MKIFASPGLFAGLLLAWQLEAAMLEQVEYVRLPGNIAEVRLTFDGPLPSPTGYTLLEPPRLVLDLAGVRNGLGTGRRQLAEAVTLSLVETEELTRLVLATPEPVSLQTSISGQTLSLLLGSFSGPESGFTGERISLNFQDIEVRAALQLLADFTGLNLVAGDTVTGSITLQLNDLPWDQILHIILRSRGLEKRQEGEVLIIAPAEELAEQDRLALETRQQLAELAPLTTEFIEVHYANAEELLKLFRPEANEQAGVISPRGRVLVDQRTNSIILTDTEENIARFRTLLRRLDVPVRQVLIEARIVSASNSVGERLGVSWGGYVQKKGSRGDTLVSGGRGTLHQLIQPQEGDGGGRSINLGTSDQLVVDLGVDTPGATSIALGLLTDSGLLELEINALASEGKAEVIARPKIITSDKTQARIASGLQIPFEQATALGATSISFQEATLSLQVTPQITPDDRIIMRLEISQDTLGVETAAGPAINTNQISTQVHVDNGETIVLGGIFTTSKSETRVKTPLLGDLPLAGALFRRTTREDRKEELLIFITPRLIQDKQTSP